MLRCFLCNLCIKNKRLGWKKCGQSAANSWDPQVALKSKRQGMNKEESFSSISWAAQPITWVYYSREQKWRGHFGGLAKKKRIGRQPASMLLLLLPKSSWSQHDWKYNYSDFSCILICTKLVHVIYIYIYEHELEDDTHIISITNYVHIIMLYRLD